MGVVGGNILDGEHLNNLVGAIAGDGSGSGKAEGGGLHIAVMLFFHERGSDAQLSPLDLAAADSVACSLPDKVVEVLPIEDVPPPQLLQTDPASATENHFHPPNS